MFLTKAQRIHERTIEMSDELETRPIPGIPNYAGRADGQIVNMLTGRVLKQYRRGDYFQVSVRINGQARQRKVHQLMSRAFNGPRPGPRAWTTFKNGNQLDCRAENLHWVLGRREHSTGRYGEDAMNTKLTEQQVIEILNRVANGEMQKSVAARFDISAQAVHRIVRGQTWPTIERPAALKHYKVRPTRERVEPIAA